MADYHMAKDLAYLIADVKMIAGMIDKLTKRVDALESKK